MQIQTDISAILGSNSAELDISQARYAMEFAFQEAMTAAF
jgi:hypothetical protein